MVGQTDAFRLPVQAHPPLPQGLPSWLPVALSPKKASHVSHFSQKASHGEVLNGHLPLPGNELRFFAWDPRKHWLLGDLLHQFTSLQQAHRDGSQQA